MPSRRKATRTKRRPTSFSNVKPVAIASENSSEAVIPVAIKTTAESPDAEAVMAVEVQTSSGKTRKPAAVVPVTVKRRRNAAAKKGPARAARASAERITEIRQAEVREQRAPKQQDIVTRSVVALADAEETAVNMAGQLGISVTHILPRLVRSALGTAAYRVNESAEAISSEMEATEEAPAA